MANKHSKKKSKKSTSNHLYRGILEITRSGMGFVVVPNLERDILVRPNDFNTALNGDIVRVKIVKKNPDGRRMQGEVVEVIERKQTEFFGRFDIGSNFAFFIPDSEKPMPDIYVPLHSLNGARDNDRAIVRIVEWEKDKRPQGEVVQLITSNDLNEKAMKEILLQNGFPVFFPEAVLEESNRLPHLIEPMEIARRRDLREVLTFTIDPVDAKDFDDAISIRALKNEIFEIGVHIADVSHFVMPQSELDKEAYLRATSVYLPDRVNPMLPERISNELCSLRPLEDKLCFSAIFQISLRGEIKDYWLGKTVIHSDHRFTYEEVQDIIETKLGRFSSEILTLNGLAQKFRRHRFKKGAINFASTEVRFVLDETGKPLGVVVKENKEAHQLIEEFMLLANRTVAENVSQVKSNRKPIPFPYRVHDTPDKEKLLPFIEFAKKYGHHFDVKSPEAIAHSFNEMLAAVRGKPEQHVLEQLGIRTMSKAIYSTGNIGHYGLGFRQYCHFTSPIRRYPDILVHRILEECILNRIVIDKNLEEKCKHCSERERAAMESERAANKYKQVEFMQQYIGEEFDSVISGVASFGFWVETIDQKCEGLVSLNSLIEYDDFRLVESEYALVGRRSGRKFQMGDKVTAKLVAANSSKRQLDFEWVLNGKDIDEETYRKKSKRKKGK
ncbi:MAG TPA: ribonuclease R [Puia sp.]|nr:ribonuclease R [Puia sp.]